MGKLSEIRQVIKKTEKRINKIEDVAENQAIDADMIRTEKAMAYEVIKEIIIKGSE